MQAHHVFYKKIIMKIKGMNVKMFIKTNSVKYLYFFRKQNLITPIIFRTNVILGTNLRKTPTHNHR